MTAEVAKMQPATTQRVNRAGLAEFVRSRRHAVLITWRGHPYWAEYREAMARRASR